MKCDGCNAQAVANVRWQVTAVGPTSGNLCSPCASKIQEMVLAHEAANPQYSSGLTFGLVVSDER